MRNFNHEIKGMVFNFIFIIANLFIVINFNNQVFLASALLFTLAAVTFVKWKTYQTIVVFLAGGFILTAIEMLSANYGVLTYSIQNFAGIPLWLFFFLGNTSVFLYRGYIEIKKIKNDFQK